MAARRRRHPRRPHRPRRPPLGRGDRGARHGRVPHAGADRAAAGAAHHVRGVALPPLGAGRGRAADPAGVRGRAVAGLRLAGVDPRRHVRGGGHGRLRRAHPLAACGSRLGRSRRAGAFMAADRRGHPRRPHRPRYPSRRRGDRGAQHGRVPHAGAGRAAAGAAGQLRGVALPPLGAGRGRAADPAGVRGRAVAGLRLAGVDPRRHVRGGGHGRLRRAHPLAACGSRLGRSRRAGAFMAADRRGHPRRPHRPRYPSRRRGDRGAQHGRVPHAGAGRAAAGAAGQLRGVALPPLGAGRGRAADPAGLCGRALAGLRLAHLDPRRHLRSRRRGRFRCAHPLAPPRRRPGRACRARTVLAAGRRRHPRCPHRPRRPPRRRGDRGARHRRVPHARADRAAAGAADHLRGVALPALGADGRGAGGRVRLRRRALAGLRLADVDPCRAPTR